MDGAIDDYQPRVSWNATKEKVTPCTTLCLGGTEVGGIGVYIQYHVGCSVTYFCIRVCPYVVKELIDALRVSSVGVLCCAAIADSAMRILGSTARVKYRKVPNFLYVFLASGIE